MCANGLEYSKIALRRLYELGGKTNAPFTGFCGKSWHCAVYLHVSLLAGGLLADSYGEELIKALTFQRLTKTIENSIPYNPRPLATDPADVTGISTGLPLSVRLGKSVQPRRVVHENLL
jgi:hypothetical protein